MGGFMSASDWRWDKIKILCRKLGDACIAGVAGCKMAGGAWQAANGERRAQMVSNEILLTGKGGARGIGCKVEIARGWTAGY